MYTKEQLEKWLEEVGSYVTKPMNIYMIGGCALSFRGLKSVTKDIDIILTSQKDFDMFDTAIKKAGFTSMTERESEFYLTALSVYQKIDVDTRFLDDRSGRKGLGSHLRHKKSDESRIDVFLNQVGKMLRLTENMKKRSKLYKHYHNMAVYLVSNEDIFLFKAMTSREGDTLDCDRIMKKNLDYNLIYQEIVDQSINGKNWFFWVYESLCRLENYNNITIPIKNRMFALVKKHWKDRPSDFMSDVSNLEKHLPGKKL